MATQTHSGSSSAKSKSGAKSASRSASRSTSKAASAKSSTTKSAAAKKPAPRVPKGQERVKNFEGKEGNQPLALAFLMKQHRQVESWFTAFERAKSDEEKTELCAQICQALKVHTQIEEELLYPDAHEKLADEDLVDEAIVEHQSAKDLIAQIESMSVQEHLYDAKVKVLGEYVKHHVREEESEMFPQLRKSDIDLVELGERLRARAEELMGRMEAEGGQRRSGLMGLFGLGEART